MLKIEKGDPKQWGLLALSSSDSDEPSSSRKSVTTSTSFLNFPQISKFNEITYNGKPASKFIGTINYSEDTPLFSASLVPFHNPSVQYFEIPKMQRSFPARTIFYKQRGSAHNERVCTPPISSRSIPSKQNYSILMKVRLLNFNIHPLKDDISRLSLTDNTIDLATKLIANPQTTHQNQRPAKKPAQSFKPTALSNIYKNNLSQEENGFETTQRMIRELFNQLNQSRKMHISN